MPALSAWYVKKGATSYLLEASGQRITYRPNNFQKADLSFDITKPSDPVRGVFANEDAVQVWIGDPASGGVLMLDGYITDLDDIHFKNAKVQEKLEVTDFISYRAAKTVFEKRYWFLANSEAKTVFADAVATISGAGPNIIDASLTTQVKQEFLGTYAKDGFSAAAQFGGADYFGDENKSLNAFPHGSKDLTTGGTRYKIVDYKPTFAYEIKVDSNFQYNLAYNSMQKFRTVIVTNGISYTFPDDINLWSIEKSDLRGKHGREFSQHFLMTTLDYNKINFPSSPVPFDIGQLNIGDDNIPVAVLYVANNTQNINMLVGQMELTNFTFPSMAIPLNTWQEISFFMRQELTPTPTNIQILLVDLAVGTFSRYIKQGATNLLLAGGMVFLRFQLPTTTANNGWTKDQPGTPTKIDQIQIVFTPATGYTAATSVKFSQFYLFKRVRKQSATAAGSPLTTKIIVNRTVTDENVLQSLADKEYARVNTNAYRAECTFAGNTDFKRPSYNVDVNFVATLGTGKLGTQLRMDEIVHTLEKSRHRTKITLKPAFQRL